MKTIQTAGYFDENVKIATTKEGTAFIPRRIFTLPVFEHDPENLKEMMKEKEVIEVVHGEDTALCTVHRVISLTPDTVGVVFMLFDSDTIEMDVDTKPRALDSVLDFNGTIN